MSGSANTNGGPAAAAAAATTTTSSASFFQGSPFTKLALMGWIVSYAIGAQHPSFLLFPSTATTSIIGSGSSGSGSNRYHTGEMILSVVYLIPHLKQMEREMGSRQFLVWLLWMSIGGYFGIGAIVSLFFHDNNHNNDNDSSSSSAQQQQLRMVYILIGGTLAHLMKYIPRSHPQFVGVLGFHFSEKALPGLLACYILGSHGITTIVQGMGGYGLCILYFMTVQPSGGGSGGIFSFLRIPNIIVRLVPWESLGSLLLLDPNPPVYAPLMARMMAMQRQGNHGERRRVGQRGRMGGGDVGSTGTGSGTGDDLAPLLQRNRTTASTFQGIPTPPPVAAAVPVPPPPTEAIEQLTAMGFEENQVRQALEVSGNNVERAANVLLSGM